MQLGLKAAEEVSAVPDPQCDPNRFHRGKGYNSGAPMMKNKNPQADLGTTGGEWLFRQGELVLGPVSAQKLVEKLFHGELNGGSEVRLLGDGHFTRLSEVEFFKLHLAKAEAKLRVDGVAQAEKATRKKKRQLRMAIVASLAVLFATGAAAGARWLAIHNPWNNVDELAGISVEPPTIALALPRASDDLVDYPGPGGLKTQRKSGERLERTRLASLKADRGSKGQEEPDGLRTGLFDRDSINATVAARQKTLYSCVADEVRRRPGLNAKIPIEFVIGNDGKVNKLWIDHPTFKEGSLQECLLRELQKWSFKAYPGEQATVGFSFKVGKGG